MSDNPYIENVLDILRGCLPTEHDAIKCTIHIELRSRDTEFTHHDIMRVFQEYAYSKYTKEGLTEEIKNEIDNNIERVGNYFDDIGDKHGELKHVIFEHNLDDLSQKHLYATLSFRDRRFGIVENL